MTKIPLLDFMTKSGLIMVIFFFFLNPPLLYLCHQPHAQCLIGAPLLLSVKKIMANAFTCFIPDTLDICNAIKNAALQAALQLGSLKRICRYHCIFGRDGGWGVGK